MDSVDVFEHLHLGDLRTAVTTSTTVAANWKIIVENYQECLHCSWVHPELVDIVPTYKTGSVVDPDRVDGGVRLRGNSFSMTVIRACPCCRTWAPTRPSRTTGPRCSPTCPSTSPAPAASSRRCGPNGAGETTVVVEYLFAAETIADADFDPGRDRRLQ